MISDTPILVTEKQKNKSCIHVMLCCHTLFYQSRHIIFDISINNLMAIKEEIHEIENLWGKIVI